MKLPEDKRSMGTLFLFLAAQKNLFMTQNGFTMYMLSRENDVVNPDHARVHQDMRRPLAHYFISSSHNTYLTKDQVTSASSTEPYIRYSPRASLKHQTLLICRAKRSSLGAQGSEPGLPLRGARLLGWR